MSIPIATDSAKHGPIPSNWTIATLIDWLADDSRQHDVSLQEPLMRIEAAATGSGWRGTPSTVALIRSLVEAVRRAPDLGSIPICDLVDGRESFTVGAPPIASPDRDPVYASQPA